MARSDTHSETLTRPGNCRTHGAVQASKQVPKIRFPFVVFGALRLWAHRQPFRCPLCGGPVVRG